MRFFIISLFISSFSFGQNDNIVVLNNEGKNITTSTHFSIGYSDSLIPIIELKRILLNGNPLITVSADTYLPLKDSFENLTLMDTIYLFQNIQEIDEVNIVYKVRKQESDDSLHLVDFHFVRGDLYTLEKSLKNLKSKWIRNDEDLLEVHASTILIKRDFEPLFIQKDTVYAFSNGRQKSLASEDIFSAFHKDLLDISAGNYLYKYQIFYGLINEFSILPKEVNEIEPIHFCFDKESMHFVSQQYNNPVPMEGPPIGLYYTYPHESAGNHFLNRENISFTDFSIEEGFLFNQLVGNYGFEDLVKVCEKASSDAKIVGDIAAIFDFSESKVHLYDGENFHKQMSFSIPDISESYQNQNDYDYKTKLVYYLIKKKKEYEFLEIDCISRSWRFIKAPGNITSYYHWEINDGRIYFTLSDGNIDWQRKLYSVAVGVSEY